MSGIVDKLMLPGANPRILQGGPLGPNGEWRVVVEFTDKAALNRRIPVDISLAELHEWRERK